VRVFGLAGIAFFGGVFPVACATGFAFALVAAPRTSALVLLVRVDFDFGLGFDSMTGSVRLYLPGVNRNVFLYPETP
jgi:hypothetical protein